jgi:hypothetical protein
MGGAMQSLVARRTRSALLMVTCAVAISGAVSCLGKNTLKAGELSPEGSYKAELIEGDTGAVGRWVSVVRVSKAKPTLAEKILGRGKETIFGVDVQSQRVSMKWQSDTRLEIVCRRCDPNQIEVQKTVWGDVLISYFFQ